MYGMLDLRCIPLYQFEKLICSNFSRLRPKLPAKFPNASKLQFSGQPSGNPQRSQEGPKANSVTQPAEKGGRRDQVVPPKDQRRKCDRQIL